MSKSKTPTLNVENWQNIVISTDLNCVDKTRTCDVVFVAERIPKYTQHLVRFSYGASMTPLSNVKCVTYSSILQDILNAKNPLSTTDRESQSEQMFKYAAQQIPGKNISDLEDIISPVGMSLFIKLQIMKIIETDVWLEKNEIIDAKIAEAEKLSENFVPVEPSKISKKNKESKATSKEPCAIDKLLNASSNTVKLCFDSITLPWKHLIITLVGFLEPDLFMSLFTNGVPIVSLLEITSNDQGDLLGCYLLPQKLTQYYAVLHKKEDFVETKAELSSNNFRSISKIVNTVELTQHSSEDLVRIKDSPSLRNKMSVSTTFEEFYGFSNLGLGVPESESISTRSVSSTPVHNDCLFLFKRFWDRVYELFQSETQIDFVENTFHMKYVPEMEILTSASDLDGFINECCYIFEKMSDFLRMVPVTIRQYINYIKDMRLDRLSEKIEPITIDQLLTYKNMMKKVSPECFTIPLLLHCLVEEVHNRIEKLPNKFKWQLDIQRESVVLNRRKEKVPLYLKTSLTKSFTPKTINVITKHIGVLEMPYCLRENLKLITTVKSENFDGECTNKIVLMPFKIHEDNCVEKEANFYQKGFSSDLFNANIKILSFIFPVLLLKHKFGKLRDIKKLMDENDLQGWCHQLNLPLAKLIDVIHLLLFSAEIRNKSFLEIQQKTISNYDKRFPTKSISEQLHQENVRIEGDEISKTASSGVHNQQSTMSSERECKFDKVPKIPHIDLYGIKYSENLKAAVLLQELFSAQTEFPYFQYRYVPLTDSLLVYYYQSFNKYGTVTEVFNQELLSPVCIRDFCRFVIHDIQEWLEQEENEYLANREENQLNRREDLLCSMKMEEEVASIKEKRSEKNKKTEENVKEVFQVPPVAHQKVLLPQTTPSDKPYNFIGYDLGSSRVQLTGSASTMYSKDGTTIVVDKTSWLGAKKRVTLKLKLLQHLFVMHLPSKDYHSENLGFHFTLSDDTIISFSKTRRPLNSVETLYERRCTCEYKTKKKQSTSAYRKPQKSVYCFSEEQEAQLLPLSMPFIPKEEIIVPPTPIGCFLQSIQKLNENIIRNFPDKIHELEFEKSYTEEEMQWENNGEEDFPGNNENEVIGIENEENLNPFELYDFSSDVVKPTSYVSNVKSDSTCASGERIKKGKSQNRRLFLSQRKKMFKFLGIENQLKYPKFKVISSMLHRDEYIKRVKSSVTIPIRETTRRLFIKTSFPKARKTVKTTKWYPIFPPDPTTTMTHCKFEVQSSLKSGLMVVTIPGFNDASLQIKQFYVDKGPACSVIANEQYRIFVDGMVIIKERNGNYKILCADGSIVNFEMPHSGKEIIKLRPPVLKDNYGNVKRCGYVPLGLKDKKSKRYSDKLFKFICRNEKHLINGSSRFLFRRQKKVIQERRKSKAPIFYVEKNDITKLIDFHIVTPTGVRIRSKRHEPIKKDVLLVGSEVDTKAEQIAFEREDGTHSILDNEGTLITQFSDGTRIKSYVICDENFIVHFIEDKKGYFGRETSELNINDSQKKEEGWLVIVLSYEYEHPCYSKVIYNSYINETTVVFPNNSTIRFDDKGVVFLTLSKGVDINLSEKSIDILTKPCPLCPCKSECSLDILPLYNKQHALPNKAFLKMFDSHGNLFKVSYDGTCKTKVGKSADTEHCKHDFTELGKLFVVNRDLSGCKFWDSKLLLRFKTSSKDCTDHSVELHKKSTTNEINCIDFKSVVKKAYFEEFLRPYEYPYLRLEKYKPKTLCPRNMVYTTYRTINVIPASEKLAPFYRVIFNAVKKMDAEITDFKCLLSRLTDISLHKDLDDLIKLQMKLSSSDNIADEEELIEKLKSKQKLRHRASSKKHDLQAEMLEQFRIPFENEFILCEKELAPDFRQALHSYNKWYSSLFRCKCKTPQIRTPPKCFRKGTSTTKHGKGTPCAKEVKDYCEISKTSLPIIKSTCKKQQSLSLESIVNTVPCAVNTFLKGPKTDCTLLKIKGRTSKRITEKDKNVIVCQIMKIKDTESATVIKLPEILSGSTRKSRKPFTIRSSGTDCEPTRTIPCAYKIYGDSQDVGSLYNGNNSSCDKYVNKHSDFREGKAKDIYEVIHQTEGTTKPMVLSKAVTTKNERSKEGTRRRKSTILPFRNDKGMNFQQEVYGNQQKLHGKFSKTCSLTHPCTKPAGMSTKKKLLETNERRENPTLSGNCLRRVSNAINLNDKASSSKRESDTKLVTAASQAKMIFSGTLYSKLATTVSTSSVKGLRYSSDGQKEDKTSRNPVAVNKSSVKTLLTPDELKDIVSELTIFDRNNSKKKICGVLQK